MSRRTGPAAASSPATIASTSAATAMSAGAGMPPSSATTAATTSGSGPLTATRAPSAASRAAVARPMPWVALVTSASGPARPAAAAREAGGGR